MRIFEETKARYGMPKFNGLPVAQASDSGAGSDAEEEGDVTMEENDMHG